MRIISPEKRSRGWMEKQAKWSAIHHGTIMIKRGHKKRRVQGPHKRDEGKKMDQKRMHQRKREETNGKSPESGIVEGGEQRGPAVGKRNGEKHLVRGSSAKSADETPCEKSDHEQ